MERGPPYDGTRQAPFGAQAHPALCNAGVGRGQAAAPVGQVVVPLASITHYHMPLLLQRTLAPVNAIRPDWLRK